MTLGLKITREPQPDMSAPDVPDYAEADAIRAMCFVADVKAGRDSLYRYNGHATQYRISSFLSDRSKEASQYLFFACNAALNKEHQYASVLLSRYVELCANEFAQETE